MATSRFNKENMPKSTPYPTHRMAGHSKIDGHATSPHAIDFADGIEAASLWLIPDEGYMSYQEITTEFNHRMIQFLEENQAHSDSFNG
jgi:hypothetical protein